MATEPNAAKEYGDRLKLLEKPVTSKLLGAAAFKPWFPSHKLRPIKDAPGDLTGAVAANDGKYFWIFYPASGSFTKLMVAKVNACENLQENKH